MAATADQSCAAVWGKTRNNHGLTNKCGQTGTNYHGWEDPLTERPCSVVSHWWGELTARADYGAGRELTMTLEVHRHSSV